ncbi:glycosyltransferase [Bacillus sp. CECT 9360]|uniref:glycosyltransferase n=1 Tax=Bacillus sp. CECT 9360 TaxID=2845821 RepID=UPI001E4CFC8C|nr:glycosyltransferase [Bacillus sp. CECT 9360]CAH0344877.1 UDP-N-acetylglucosamine--peptide N-acetylglucosaminyltransferase GtfA subunit [Bacillus sp. CECT 9360]
MNSTLVILSNRYPYPPGEEFLKAELDVLSKHFKRIFLIPTNRSIIYDQKTRKDVPDNVEVIHLFKGDKRSSLSRVIDIMKSTKNMKWFWGELSHSIRHGLKAPLIMLNRLALACEIKNKLQKAIPDGYDYIFYSYWLTPSALALAMLKEDEKIDKAVSRVHGGDLYAERHNPAYIPFQGKVISVLDQTYSISENGLNYLINKHSDVEDKLSVQRLGTKSKVEYDQLNWDKQSAVLRLVSCSYLKPVKRIHLLADALKHCHFPVEWTHIGDGPERANIEKIVATLPEQIKVNLLGNKNNDEIMELYRSLDFDVFVNVSESEGIPVTIMEAFSFGIPVVATDVGGTSEVVNADNGILLPKDLEPLDIAAQITHFHNFSLEEKIKKGKAAYSTWDHSYNAEKNYTKFATLLKD